MVEPGQKLLGSSWHSLMSYTCTVGSLLELSKKLHCALVITSRLGTEKTMRCQPDSTYHASNYGTHPEPRGHQHSVFVMVVDQFFLASTKSMWKPCLHHRNISLHACYWVINLHNPLALRLVLMESLHNRWQTKWRNYRDNNTLTVFHTTMGVSWQRDLRRLEDNAASANRSGECNLLERPWCASFSTSNPSQIASMLWRRTHWKLLCKLCIYMLKQLVNHFIWKHDMIMRGLSDLVLR